MKKNFDKLIRIALLAPFVAAMVIHGSTKPAPVVGTITYLRTEADVQYIYDAGSFVSNDLVHVAFTFAVAPGTADFQLWAWPRSSTNEEEMVLVYSNTLAGVAQPYEFEYAGAISNRWFGFTTWTPGPSVHTNGVALVNWQLPYDPAATNIAAMTRTGVYIDGEKLAPNVIALPYDAEVEYLRDTSNAYIDTGITPNLATMSMGVRFRPTGNITSSTWCILVGSRQGKTYAINYNNSLRRSTFDYSSGGYIAGGTCTPSAFTTCECVVNADTRTATGIVDGNITATKAAASGICTGTAWLFHTADASRGFSTDIAEFWIKEADRYLIHLIPVRKGYVGYMYDRVSGRLFGNAGTGAFIIGPDK